MRDKDELQAATRNLARECSSHAAHIETTPAMRWYWQQWARRLNDVANGMAMTDETSIPLHMTTG